MKILKIIKNWFTYKNRRCVRCGRAKPNGGWISVNVYDRVLGRHMGVECGRKDCTTKEGSPAWVRDYWNKWFFDVISRPDYFANYATKEIWDSFIDELPSYGTRKRAKEIRDFIFKKYGRTK